MTAEAGDVILEGKAPAGVVHFLADAPALGPDGKRATFKDGERFSSAKPSANAHVTGIVNPSTTF